MADTDNILMVKGAAPQPPFRLGAGKGASVQLQQLSSLLYSKGLAECGALSEMQCDVYFAETSQLICSFACKSRVGM